MWSSNPAGGGIRQTPARLRWERVREGAGMMGCPAVTDWWPEPSLGSAVEGGSAGLHGGGCRKPGSGERLGRPGQCAGGQVQVGEGRARGVQPARDWSGAPSSPRSTHGGTAAGSASREAGDRGPL
jgi:hypothetical protein